MDSKQLISQDKLLTIKHDLRSAFPGDVHMTDLVKCVTKCMSLVGNIKELKGHDKKELVIYLVKCVLEATDSGPLEFMEYIVPQIIDSLIEVEKGKLRFNPRVKCFNVFKLKCI
jgi:hypothetical protein